MAAAAAGDKVNQWCGGVQQKWLCCVAWEGVKRKSPNDPDRDPDDQIDNAYRENKEAQTQSGLRGKSPSISRRITRNWLSF